MEVTKFENHLAFSDQKVYFCCFSRSKRLLTGEIFVLTKVLFVTAILTIALLSENSTTP